MANMVSNNLTIKPVVRHARLEELRPLLAASHYDSPSDHAIRAARMQCLLELHEMQVAARMELTAFGAGTYCEGLGWLVPVPDEPSPDEQAQWREVLLAERRAKRPEQDMAAYEKYLMGHINNLQNDWRCHVWGCSNIIFEAQTLSFDDDELSYSFETKWSPPFRWVRAIADRYPAWGISLSAHDSEEHSWRVTYLWHPDRKEWLEYSREYCVMCGGDRHQGACPEPGPVRNDDELFQDTFFG